MTIQRTKHEVMVMKNDTDSRVGLYVHVEGIVEDRGDALLMLIDAWAQAMIEEGLDPDKSFMRFRNEGRLQ